jgi:hypothetical protein
VDHVGEGIAGFSAFGYHAFHSLPGVAVCFHGGDDFEDSFDLLYVLLDEFCFSAERLLLFY